MTARVRGVPPPTALLALPLLLGGCGVEQVQSDIADQQLCASAAEATADAGSAGPAALDAAAAALARLAGLARDAELRAALEARAAAVEEQRSALVTPGGDDARATRAARAAQEELDRVCQRLSAF